MSRGVSQCSDIGPILWHAMYNGVLSIGLPEGVPIVGYADDVILVVVAKRITTVERKCSESMQSVQNWLRNNGLELAKQLQTIRVDVDDHVIESTPQLRYLRVVIDARMTFQGHSNRASEEQ